MDPAAITFAGTTVGFAITTIVALFLLRNSERELADRTLADANALAADEKNRADVAEKQLAAEQSARKADQDAADQQLEDALKNGGTLDPTAGWDRHAGGAPGGVLPSAAPAAGAGAGAAAVPDRKP